jgi:hypothetical protein
MSAWSLPLSCALAAWASVAHDERASAGVVPVVVPMSNSSSVPSVVAPPLAPPPAAPAREGPWRDLSVVSVALLGAQIVTLSVLSQFPATSTGWGDGSFDNILRNDLAGPIWDGDPWYWNYVTHPIAGAEYYLLARNRSVPWFWSLAYAAGMSAFWEGVTEAYYERPSGQDLLVTPLVGAFVGEVRYRIKEHVLEGQGRHAALWRVIVAVILDPADAVTGGL